MPKKLMIVVPHYKESWEVCKPLFDSIELQQGINKDDFEVLVVNDGDDVVLHEAVFDPYSFQIDYIIKPHGGISDTRNFGIEHGDSEYIMFCDCDDMFLNNYGLHLIFGAIEEGFDFLYSTFIEEQHLNDKWKIYRRDKDIIFVHGKCYRRQFLIDKNIMFSTRAYFSEDTPFNKICFHESEATKTIETPFYLWKWRDDSTVRNNRENLVIREYAQVMLMRETCCRELEERGFIDEYFDAVCKTIIDSYYDFNEPQFNKPENAKYRKEAEKEFKKFYANFKEPFMECASDRIARIMMESRLSAYKAGLVMEKTDLKSWLKHIENDVTA